MNPYRGFVEVRELVDNTISDAVSTLVSAIEAQRLATERPTPKHRGYGPDYLSPLQTIFTRDLKARGYTAIRVMRMELDRAIEVRAKHRCGSLQSVPIVESALEYGDQMKVICQALDSFACYCVSPPPIPCVPACTDRSCASWDPEQAR